MPAATIRLAATCRASSFRRARRLAARQTVLESRTWNPAFRHPRLPLCKGRLEHDRQHAELVCRADRLAFPVRDGIPVMLEGEARSLDDAPAS